MGRATVLRMFRTLKLWRRSTCERLRTKRVFKCLTCLMCLWIPKGERRPNPKEPKHTEIPTSPELFEGLKTGVGS